MITRIEQELSKAIKKIKNTSKFTQRMNHSKVNEKSSIEASELLDLKSELYSLKNKLLQ